MALCCHNKVEHQYNILLIKKDLLTIYGLELGLLCKINFAYWYNCVVKAYQLCFLEYMCLSLDKNLTLYSSVHFKNAVTPLYTFGSLGVSG